MWRRAHVETGAPARLFERSSKPLSGTGRSCQIVNARSSMATGRCQIVPGTSLPDPKRGRLSLVEERRSARKYQDSCHSERRSARKYQNFCHSERPSARKYQDFCHSERPSARKYQDFCHSDRPSARKYQNFCHSERPHREESAFNALQEEGL
jgi:hypothetical protein